jgi:hypothetical protein
LTTFYEAEAEDSEDREKLELAWQEPAPLAAELRKLIAALEQDALAQTLVRRGNAEGIAAQAGALADLLEGVGGHRVRLVYAL